ncbi:MAG: cob(I)yrinic acid a,c-diamide adenosyltransferase [Planctomycetota bacterium]
MSDPNTQGDPKTHEQRMERLAEEQSRKTRAADTSRGVLVVQTGDGKGKSTSGFGVALRAIGHGQRVGIVQFIKGTWKTGEREVLRRLPEVDLVVSGDGFTWVTKDREQDIASARAGLDAARRFILGGEHHVVVLDEINVAMGYGYLDPDEVVELLLSRPEHVSVVLTGRNAPDAIVAAADTVTEHRVVKHAFKAGIRARNGVEF